MDQDRILVSITGMRENEWKDKLKEIKRRRFTKVALFLECYHMEQRLKIYKALEKSCVEHIPLVHIRNDMERWELAMLEKTYKSKCLTIHENTFNVMDKWKGHFKNLYLEFNYDNHVADNVDVSRIGGFCVDLSHFKSSEERWTKDFLYVFKRRHNKKLFMCNHLNGFDPKKRIDIHHVTNLKQLDYLITLPKFVFGKYIAIETFNSIKEQLQFKKYVLKILKTS